MHTTRTGIENKEARSADSWCHKKENCGFVIFIVLSLSQSETAVGQQFALPKVLQISRLCFVFILFCFLLGFAFLFFPPWCGMVEVHNLLRSEWL